MKICPLGKRFLIKKIKDEQKVGTILMLDSTTEKQEHAEVVALGQDFSDAYKDVMVGMRVIYNKHAGQKITSEGEEYLMIREEDILAVIK